jgi:hypothetical protein
MIPVLFGGLDQRRGARALTTLARAALAEPGAGSLIAAALANDLEALAVPALAIAAETHAAVGDLLEHAIAATDPPDQAFLQRIADELPYPTIALAGTAAVVHFRLADLAAGDPTKRAGHLISLSNSLGCPRSARDGTRCHRGSCRHLQGTGCH